MLWLGIGVVLVVALAWTLGQWSSREAVTRLRQPADPFVDRRSMVRYHAALRPKRH